MARHFQQRSELFDECDGVLRRCIPFTEEIVACATDQREAALRCFSECARHCNISTEMAAHSHLGSEVRPVVEDCTKYHGDPNVGGRVVKHNGQPGSVE